MRKSSDPVALRNECLLKRIKSIKARSIVNLVPGGTSAGQRLG